MSTEYSDQQYEDNYPDGIESHYWNVARNAVVLSAISPVPTDVVLDIGCGRGIVVQYLRAHGVNCWGCEVGRPRPLAADVQPYLMLGIDACEVDDTFAASVTQLLFLDVLEHLSDPVSLLTGCRLRFPQVRRVTITLPARRELWTNYDEWFGHYRRYDLADVQALVQCLSPRAVVAGYFFHALYPALRVTAFLGQRRTTAMAAPAGPIGRAAHRALGTGLRICDRVLPSWLPGSSIRAVVHL